MDKIEKTARRAQMAFLCQKIEETGLKVRSKTVLQLIDDNSHKPVFLWEIANLDAEELLKYRNFRKISLDQIKSIFQEVGLEFGKVDKSLIRQAKKRCPKSPPS